MYSGDLDFLLNHWGTEVAIQNMSWCGGQGFTHKPDKTFVVDGKVAGSWGAEVHGFSFLLFLLLLFF